MNLRTAPRGCRSGHRLLAVLLVLLSWARPGDAQQTPAIPAGPVAGEIDRYVQALADSGTFRGTVLVATGDSVMFRKGYGFADEQWKVANTPNSAFRIGSLSKQFTAAAVLLLQDQGKLSVTAEICRYLRPCPDGWGAITIHHLLTHTSGIPDLVRLPGFAGLTAFPTTLDRTIDRFRLLPLTFPPGTRFDYSNSGYTVAARIVELVSGMAYEQFLRDHIYLPIGMSRSGYAHQSRVVEHEARGYRLEGGILRNATYLDMSIPVGAGSEYSTADDLLAYVSALRAGRILSDSARASMFRPHMPSYGYGWELGMQLGHRVASHAGGINGYSACWAYFPDRGLTVIVLANLEGSPVKRMADDISRVALAR